MTQTYIDKSSQYFSNARTQIAPLLPVHARNVLEVGCGAGGTIRWLKETGRVERAWGMELFESAAAVAREHCEDVVVGDAETLIRNSFASQQFDLMLCLDVLEHMVDPWRFLTTAQGLLAPGGKLIISVPNIRCARVLWPLLTRGEWRYADDGILDRTHLRFFTRESALQLGATSNLRVQRCLGSVVPHTLLAKVERWTRGVFNEFTSQQFLILSERPA